MGDADPDLAGGVGGHPAPASRSAASSSGPDGRHEPRSRDATWRRCATARTLHYDLFLGVPVHRAPAVVEESGLTVDGWIPVDHTTFATRFPDVYAVGDVTSAPVPRVGVIAEGEAGTVADVLDPPPPRRGRARAVPGRRDVLHRVRRRARSRSSTSTSSAARHRSASSPNRRSNSPRRRRSSARPAAGAGSGTRPDRGGGLRHCSAYISSITSA